METRTLGVADRRYFVLLQDFVNIVHDKAVGGPFEFGRFAESDARAFLDALPL